MPDEAPAVTQDKPEDAPDTGQAPDQGSEEQQLDPAALQQSYDELRREYTQRTQEWATQSQQAEYHEALIAAASDPESPDHLAALDALGLTYPEDDDEEFTDETEELRAELEQVKATLAEQSQSAEAEYWAEAEEMFEAERIAELQAKDGRDYDETDIELLVSVAEANRKQDGEPDFEKAHQALLAYTENRQKDWVSTKGRAPRPPGSGPAAQRTFDVNDPKARIAAAEEAAYAAGAE